MEDGAPSASEANGSSAADDDFGEYRANLARNNFGDFCEADAVFVAEGQVTEQVTRVHDAAFFEYGGAVRAYAAQILYRGCQGNGHSIAIAMAEFIAAVCSISLATSAVHPVWWLAPNPAPVSPWKYS